MSSLGNNITVFNQGRRLAYFIKAWNLYGKMNPIINNKGETRIMAWDNAFLNYNLNFVTDGYPITEVPPGFAPLPP
jgi:hypothetical protein